MNFVVNKVSELQDVVTNHDWLVIELTSLTVVQHHFPAVVIIRSPDDASGRRFSSALDRWVCSRSIFLIRQLHQILELLARGSVRGRVLRAVLRLVQLPFTVCSHPRRAA